MLMAAQTAKRRGGIVPIGDLNRIFCAKNAGLERVAQERSSGNVSEQNRDAGEGEAVAGQDAAAGVTEKGKTGRFAVLARVRGAAIQFAAGKGRVSIQSDRENLPG